MPSNEPISTNGPERLGQEPMEVTDAPSAAPNPMVDRGLPAAETSLRAAPAQITVERAASRNEPSPPTLVQRIGRWWNRLGTYDKLGMGVWTGFLAADIATGSPLALLAGAFVALHASGLWTRMDSRQRQRGS